MSHQNETAELDALYALAKEEQKTAVSDFWFGLVVMPQTNRISSIISLKNDSPESILKSWSTYRNTTI